MNTCTHTRTASQLATASPSAQRLGWDRSGAGNRDCTQCGTQDSRSQELVRGLGGLGTLILVGRGTYPRKTFQGLGQEKRKCASGKLVKTPTYQQVLARRPLPVGYCDVQSRAAQGKRGRQGGMSDWWGGKPPGLKPEPTSPKTLDLKIPRPLKVLETRGTRPGVEQAKGAAKQEQARPAWSAWRQGTSPRRRSGSQPARSHDEE